jgi:hypothetical protein
MLHLGCMALASAVLAGGPAQAQEFGNAQNGSAIAQELCSACQGIQPSGRESPQADAPTSVAVARTLGMTATALLTIFQTSHRNMPNLRLEPDQISDVTEHPL